MPTPYFHSELFAPNKLIEVQKCHLEPLGDLLIIDDFYEHADDIHSMLQNSWAPCWKRNRGSRNFVDYYDCRLNFSGNDNNLPREYESQQLIWDLCASQLGYAVRRDPQPYDFNIFKWINTPDENIQSYPHVDSHGSKEYMACVVYLNKDEDCNGGTAFYGESEVNPDVGKMEGDDIQIDIDKHYTFLDFVPAKYNRAVIYPGSWMHGAYIEDHKFYTDDRWRMNQVYFFELV